MSASIIYITDNPARAEAFKAICAGENYELVISMAEDHPNFSNYELIFCDAAITLKSEDASNIRPIVAVYDAASASELQAATSGNSIDVLAYPFNAIEAAARLRCLSRLHMLQEEINHRQSIHLQSKNTLSVLLIGTEAACATAQQALAPECSVEYTDDDITGLLRAGQGDWSCVVLALSDTSREPATFIRQLRLLASARTMPVLIYTETADERCVKALLAGANDLAIHGCTSGELSKRIHALALRKSVLDKLRSDAAIAAPLTEFDHVTGLPGQTQLMRTMATSLKRLEAQGKPGSLLLIAVDPPVGVPEGDAIPDSVMLTLTQVLRRSLRGFDYACRFGPDSFAIFMPGADALNAELVAKRICAEIKSERVRVKETRKDGTTASIGLATMAVSDKMVTANDMIATASDALVKAQVLGASQVMSLELNLAA